MITIAACLWDANEFSDPFSVCFDESWADKLYRGFKRHLSKPFRFVIYVDRERTFGEPEIEQRLLREPWHCGNCLVQPLESNEPIITMGLDTMITGNCDPFVEYAMTGDRIAVPLDPYFPETVCTGMVICPGGMGRDFVKSWDGPADVCDMNLFRQRQDELGILDTMFPGMVRSHKVHIVRDKEPTDNVRVCYFHGSPKPHELGRDPWIAEHWR